MVSAEVRSLIEWMNATITRCQLVDVTVQKKRTFPVVNHHDHACLQSAGPVRYVLLQTEACQRKKHAIEGSMQSKEAWCRKRHAIERSMLLRNISHLDAKAHHEQSSDGFEEILAQRRRPNV